MEPRWVGTFWDWGLYPFLPHSAQGADCPQRPSCCVTQGKALTHAVLSFLTSALGRPRSSRVGGVRGRELSYWEGWREKPSARNCPAGQSVGSPALALAGGPHRKGRLRATEPQRPNLAAGAGKQTLWAQLCLHLTAQREEGLCSSAPFSLPVSTGPKEASLGWGAG